MKRLFAGTLIPGLLLLSGAPASAQEWQVAREQFAFAGSRLDVRIDVETAGSLRILRGGPGTVRVAGRAISGFTAAGLTSDEELTLTALSDGPVHYMISVPEGVWINVRLPDRHGTESVGGYTRGRTFEWRGFAEQEDAWAPYGDDGGRLQPSTPSPAPPSAPGPALVDPASTPVPLWVPPSPRDPFEATLFTTFTGAYPPAEVALPDLRWVRSITIRVEGHRFRVAASRPLSVEPGNPRLLEIRPAGPPMDLVLVLPEGTADFTLRTGDATALRLDGADLVTRCSPVTRQWLSDGRRWVTFTPVDGALECGATARLRHEG